VKTVRQTLAACPKSCRLIYDLDSTKCALPIKHLWRRSMKKRIVSITLLTSCLLYEPAFMYAQAPAKALTSPAPVPPMNVKFRYVPQYFVQSVEDDPRYARIEALVDGGRCEVVLLDKTMNRRIVYSTLSRKVDALKADGEDAYATRIDFEAFTLGDSTPLFRIRFHDRIGQVIEWGFVAGQMVPHSSPEVISRTDDSGIAFLYAPRRATAAVGTSLTIGDREYRPEPTQSRARLGTFYATDMTIGQILSGTQLWRVESGPVSLAEAAQWDLQEEGGRQSMLAIKQLYDTGALIDQIELYDPDAPEVILTLVRSGDSYSLQLMSATAHGNTLWIFFGPALPLPEYQTDDKTIVTFTVAENEDASIASGRLVIRRGFDTEHLGWQFESPDLAKGEVFETGVKLIPKDGEHAKCMNEYCSIRLRKP
jgi:hypothetical protein